MTSTLELAVPWSDHRNNHIVGRAKGSMKIHFSGENCRLEISEDVSINGHIWFDGDNSIITVGSKTVVRGDIRIGHDAKVQIGARVSMSAGCYISAVEGATVAIGSGCILATRVQLKSDDGFPVYDLAGGNRLNQSESIEVGSDVWLAYEAIVLGGSKIGNGAVIRPRSQVVGVMPEHSLVGGDPAQVLRTGVRWDRKSLSTSRS